MPRWTMSPAVWVPATRWTSLTSNRTLAVASEQPPGVGDLAAALRVERGVVEHDLGVRAGLGPQLHLGARLEHLVLRCRREGSRRSGPRRPSSRTPGIRSRRCDSRIPVAAARISSLVRARLSAFVPAPAPLALLGEGVLEPRRGPSAHAAARLRVRRSGRSGTCRCRGGGTRRGPGTTGASGRPSLRTFARSRASAVVSGISASSSRPTPASRVRLNWRSSRSIVPRISMRRSARGGATSCAGSCAVRSATGGCWGRNGAVPGRDRRRSSSTRWAARTATSRER